MSGMDRFARLRCFAILVVAAVLAILALELYRLLPPLRRPITVDIVGSAQNSSNFPVVVVRVANQTRFNFACSLWTEVLSNGVWIDALTQYPEAKMANYFPAGHKSAVQVPVPTEGDSWRLHLYANRTRLSRMESALEKACRHLRLKYRFDMPTHVFSQTNRVFSAPNKPVQATAG